ncbi:WS/DGAT domain-containing protein [Actinoplanes sp. KI2]|uniref:wax ester/triacylglycerol synthase domain-containing protein n=1 Tax=Actinoplanes sp. KI2 TaxID=2983315 RepID=UPI0021D6152F|nr:wax ester/triacylglycerol synthase domain-containing protein [Actinoplanes sp. KI2]MCU7729503.1 WS/DGAT domain-containing protein [Actinoplanes sp. KI2]
MTAPPRIERAGDADLAFLAMDRGPVPEHLGVVLVLDRPLTPAACARLLGDRAGRVPRLRQRLVRTPPGCGAPIWADDETFDPWRHLEITGCPAPGDDRALVDAVLPWVMRPLPRDRPLWRAVLIGGLPGGRCALALIAHHAISDGLGGLAVLGLLADGAAPAAVAPALPRAGTRALAADAWRSRFAGLRSAPDRARRLRTAMAAGGGVHPVRVQACSLVRVTGARRRAVVVRAPLSALRESAHRHDGGVNAALLVAVSTAVGRLLERRGETIGAVAIAVPVGTPRAPGTAAGNAVSPLVVRVPTAGPWAQRLTRVAADVRRRRAAAAGPAPITVAGGAFRLFSALGGYRWYMTHQRRLHTLVSHVRGPAGPVRLGGAVVRDMIPLVTGGASNVTVLFLALAYLDTLTVTVIADPDRCPDLDLLARLLADELTALSRVTIGPSEQDLPP